MNKTLAITLVVIGSLVLLGLAFGAGMWFTHFNTATMMSNTPYSMMRWNTDAQSYASPMMGRSNSSMGYNRMGFDHMYDDDMPYSHHMGSSYMQSPTYMHHWSTTTANTSTEPITVDQAEAAFQEYLDNYNNDDLEIAEIMIFDNNAYARITEKSTGIGAMELLAEPGTLYVHPEYGPNMMWNLEYGHMGSTGYGGMMHGGMMGGTYCTDDCFYNTQTEYSEMTVSEEEALQIAQEYLDEQYPGTETAEEAYPFYGYYTLDYLENGSPVGMLSVNGYTGQVYLHTWHGTFIDMVE